MSEDLSRIAHLEIELRRKEEQILELAQLLANLNVACRNMNDRLMVLEKLHPETKKLQWKKLTAQDLMTPTNPQPVDTNSPDLSGLA